jgi:hypothetical protein
MEGLDGLYEGGVVVIAGLTGSGVQTARSNDGVGGRHGVLQRAGAQCNERVVAACWGFGITMTRWCFFHRHL